MSLQCNRFHVDGTKCSNQTLNNDMWCRQDECAGFLRAKTVERKFEELDLEEPDFSTDKSQIDRATPREKITTTFEDLGFIPETAYESFVTFRAVNEFKVHHGGTERDAINLIKEMFHDFIVMGRPVFQRSDSDYSRVSCEGYGLIFSQQRLAVTAYHCNHRERTWQQKKLGVPSRIINSRRMHSVSKRGNPEELKRLRTFIEGLTEGQKVNAEVATIVNFGIFVDIGDFDGLIHVDQLGLSENETPRSKFSIGDPVICEIFSIDRENLRINLKRIISSS